MWLSSMTVSSYDTFNGPSSSIKSISISPPSFDRFWQILLKSEILGTTVAILWYLRSFSQTSLAYSTSRARLHWDFSIQRIIVVKAFICAFFQDSFLSSTSGKLFSSIPHSSSFAITSWLCPPKENPEKVQHHGQSSHQIWFFNYRSFSCAPVIVNE